MKLEVIYVEGCPNVEEARNNVRQALDMGGVSVDVLEWERDDPEAPEYAREYGSPTVLVDGRDVTGEAAGAGGPACRADGAPSVEAIRAGLTGAG